MWLSNKACLAPDIVTNATQESLAEARAKRDMLAVAVAAVDELDDLIEKFVAQAHVAVLHRGVGSTMAKVREYYWVPRLRRLTKKVVKSCHGCRQFRAQAYTSPPPGNLPRDRTVSQTPFQIIGVDFAGPLRYRKKPKTEEKAYILLYACSLTRACT